MRKNIHAYTECNNNYPAFLSLNKEESGEITLTARSRGDGGNNVVTIPVPPEELEVFACNIIAFLNGDEDKASNPDMERYDALLKEMVDRFLCWKLPDDFEPDCYIKFIPPNDLPAAHRPTGTNLLTANQARQMFKECLPPFAGKSA